MGIKYHGIDMGCVSAFDAWTIQEIIHARQPDRIVEIGTSKGGMCCWLRDCMAGELMHPFVIVIADAPRPEGMANYADVTWIEGPPDIASLNRIKPIIGAPTMLVVNRNLTNQQFELWSKIVGIGQVAAVLDNSLGFTVEPWRFVRIPQP